MQDRRRVNATAGDPSDRLWWRSKEALDAAEALEIALSREPTAAYVIFLQDDVVLASGYLHQLKQFIKKTTAANDTVDVVTLFTSSGGHTPVKVMDPYTVHYGLVALAFRRRVAVELTEYLRARFAEAPVDWLLNDLIKSRHKAFWVFYPNLVQHVGFVSSLPGKTQPIRSTSFHDRSCWFGPG